MSQAPEKELSEAHEVETPAASTPEPTGQQGMGWPRSLQARATRRALLLTALGALLIAGLVTAIPVGSTGPGRLSGYLDGNPVPSTGTKSDGAFNRATGGDCLMWPDTPESSKIVKCADEHKFEVAESIDMRTFPGSEYGPNAAPPTPARIQQITQEQCEAAVRNYLGAKFDPNSKFTVSLLWPGDRAWRQSGDRRMLCGLQLPGTNNRQQAFTGKVADIDQSKVWPNGTCLGIDPSTNQPTDAPVECSAPHAMEVTGMVNLAEKFPGGVPTEADQDGYIKDSCTKMTDAYLAPAKLRTTTLTLIYPTVTLSSWTAGTREVACSIGATLGNGGWATLLNSARGQLLINGQPPIPPPDIPEERLTLPPIPLQPAQPPTNQSSQAASPPEIPPNNQHLPGQQPVVTPPRAPAQQAPAQQAPAQQAPAQQAPAQQAPDQAPAQQAPLPPPADNAAPPANPAPEAPPPPPPPPAPEAPPPPPAEPPPGG